MAFPDAFLDELTARTELADLVSGYVNLKRRGSSLVGLCPFHTEKTPSFTVSPDKQLFYCFGCGSGGGAIEFVKRIENMEFADAVAWLAGRAGIALPDERGDIHAQRLRERLFKLHVDAARFFHTSLVEGGSPDVSAYLQKRRVSPKTVRHFGIGASAPGRAALVEAMSALGYTADELVAGGLALRGGGGEVYDRFRNRLIFPIINTQKRVVAFGGRAVGNSDIKYINSPETAIFSKGRNLFALNFAKSSKRGGFLLAEGYMDVISLHQAGFDHAVAPLGTALTEHQVQLIRKYTSEVTLTFDTDEAGARAAERAASMLMTADTKLFMLTPDGAKDPDEYIAKYGAAGFESLLGKREGYMDWRVSRLAASHDLSTDQGRVDFLRAAAGILSDMPGEIGREVYAGRVAALAGVQADAVRLEIKSLRTAASKKTRRREERQAASPARRAAPPGAGAAGLRAARAR
ncbi:MAG: DNA primase, partial [Oscillospiraceae bacterium]|nr:DNA primase [Oscillospiraceae bacterium]